MTGWTFEHADFRAALDDVNATDFVFADPPYGGTFAGYAAGGFSWRDHVVLAERLAQHAGPVVAMMRRTRAFSTCTVRTASACGACAHHGGSSRTAPHGTLESSRRETRARSMTSPTPAKRPRRPHDASPPTTAPERAK
jgi:hypothetical protein